MLHHQFLPSTSKSSAPCPCSPSWLVSAAALEMWLGVPNSWDLASLGPEQKKPFMCLVCCSPVYFHQHSFFHSSRTLLTLTQFAAVFCAAALTPDVFHLAFVHMIIPTYWSLPFWFASSFFALTLFSSFLDHLSIIMFNFDPNFLQLPCSPSQYNIIHKCNDHSVFSWSSQEYNADWYQLQHRSQET